MTEDHKKICEALIRGRGYINDTKLKLSLGPVFDHVPEALHFFRTSNKEARKILLLNQGEYSKEVVEKIIQPLIQFLDQYRNDDDYDLWEGIEKYKTILEKFIQKVVLVSPNKFPYINQKERDDEYVLPLNIAFYEIKQSLRRELLSIVNVNFFESEIKKNTLPYLLVITNWYKSCLEYEEILFLDLKKDYLKNNINWPLERDKVFNSKRYIQASPWKSLLKIIITSFYFINKTFPENECTNKCDKKLEYKILEEIFINKESYIICIDALKNVSPPIISEDKKYLLGKRQKGAFTAWFEVVKLRQLLSPNIIAADVAKLLNIEIIGLDLFEDGSTLKRYSTTSFKKYYTKLSKLIS